MNNYNIVFSTIMQEVENWPHTGECQWHDNRIQERKNVPECKNEWTKRFDNFVY